MAMCSYCVKMLSVVLYFKSPVPFFSRKKYLFRLRPLGCYLLITMLDN